jgi:hypothetical protein
VLGLPHPSPDRWWAERRPARTGARRPSVPPPVGRAGAAPQATPSRAVQRTIWPANSWNYAARTMAAGSAPAQSQLPRYDALRAAWRAKHTAREHTAERRRVSELEEDRSAAQRDLAASPVAVGEWRGRDHRRRGRPEPGSGYGGQPPNPGRPGHAAAGRPGAGGRGGQPMRRGRVAGGAARAGALSEGADPGAGLRSQSPAGGARGANIKFASVATDVLGRSGRAMLEALIAGVVDSVVLAGLARGTLKTKQADLQRALRAWSARINGALGRADAPQRLPGGGDRAPVPGDRRPPAGPGTSPEPTPDHPRHRTPHRRSGPGGGRGRPQSLPNCSPSGVTGGPVPGQDESAGKRRSGRTRRGSTAAWPHGVAPIGPRWRSRTRLW